MNSKQNISWDLDLIRRYDLSGPRYTSYPTAIQFTDSLTPDALIEHAQASADTRAPLSLYFHIPFCTHVCYYCGCNKIITRNRNKAQPYLETLFKEMQRQSATFSQNRTVDQLHWGGGTPTFISHDEMRALMAETRRLFTLRDDDLGDYSIEIDPREMREGTLSVLREIGFNRISLGVQDINPKVQEAVNRIQPLELTQKIMDEAQALGFKSVNIDLIYGLPHQTPESFDETLNAVIDLSPDRLSIFNYAHMPSRFRPQMHIDPKALPSGESKLQIHEETINTLIGAGYVYIGMDHFAKPTDSLAIAQQQGKLHRNFQGYTTHPDCDLLAMGVSSISKIGDTYVQNHHEIKAYNNSVDAYGHAVKRGVSMTNDDLIRAEVIKQLICHFKLDKGTIEKSFKITFDHYFKDVTAELNHFERDGLIDQNKDSIHVKDAGRLLIRRICMAFDAYIAKPEANRAFSKII